jgi:folate-dependent phosphoribosylglycinamide formyltransferase PurN
MRIVILSSSVYSETACAMAANLAGAGYAPVAALALSSLDRKTAIRKVGQWGLHGMARYARATLIPHGAGHTKTTNPYLEPMLKRGGIAFRNLREVAAFYDFPIAVCNNQNDEDAQTCLRKSSPDLIIFTGGNILRAPVLEIPRLGVLNVHLGLVPEVRGMSTPEWSLLTKVPCGITIHFMDAGIDTGPILRRYEFPGSSRCNSLGDLRHRLIALGVEKIPHIVASLVRGEISAVPQPSTAEDHQFFVMHDWLQAKAAERLTASHDREAKAWVK